MQVVSASYIKSSADYTQCPPPDLAEYAFIGRSNVGKSSLINMLCNKRSLAKTSADPGKTRLINHFMITDDAGDKHGKKRGLHWYLVDLPGYGYAKVSQKQRKSWGTMIEEYILNRSNLGALFVLIDSRHEPQTIDLDFISQLGTWNMPFALVFTKSDKNKPGVTENNVQQLSRILHKTWEELPPFFITSAMKGDGKEALLSYIHEMNQEYIMLKQQQR